tara:strand:- start:619 stop:2610 length:1992 start_codon:yes stop_codon:yes gene_type:complete
MTILAIMCLMMVPYNGIGNSSAASGTMHQGAVEHTLFFIGDADATTGSFTPSKTLLTDLQELAATSEGAASRTELYVFEQTIGADGTIPSGTWTHRINYVVEGASNVGGNWSTEIIIGGTSFLSGEFAFGGRGGSYDFPVEIDEIQVNQGDTLKLIFYLEGGVIWNSPDDNSELYLTWGGPESDAGLTMNSPLVTIDMQDANPDGDVVYFPIRLHSDYAADLADLQNMEARINGVITEDVPFISTTTSGVEIVYPWSVPVGSSSGTYSMNFTLNPQDGVTIQAQLEHQIELGEGSGDGGGWNFGTEPVRTGGSTLDLELELRQSGDRLERSSTLTIDGAVTVWMRWGLDNIGNDTLDSTSWWREISAGQSSLINSEIQDGEISDAEIQVLENHLISSPQNLADFLDRGLALDSTAILGATPFDIEGAINVDIDLRDSYEVKSSPLQIRIQTATMLEGGEITMIETFIRSQSKTYWTGVTLDARLSTNPTQGIAGVYGDGIDYSYLRYGISENVYVTFGEDDRNEDFRVTITPANSITDAPLVGLILLLIGMALTFMLMFRITKNRMRIPVAIWLTVMGAAVSILYIYGIQMNLLFGAEGGTFIMGLLIVFASPKNHSNHLSDVPDRDIAIIDCPKCNQSNPVPSDERPLRLKCGGCGRTLLIE